MTTTRKVPSIGRLVHYTYATHDVIADSVKGQSRPAIIVRVWGDAEDPRVTVQLQVFTDQENDGVDRGLLWVTSVQEAQEPTPGKWNWPPFVAPVILSSDY